MPVKDLFEVDGPLAAACAPIGLGVMFGVRIHSHFVIVGKESVTVALVFSLLLSSLCGHSQLSPVIQAQVQRQSKCALFTRVPWLGKRGVFLRRPNNRMRFPTD